MKACGIIAVVLLCWALVQATPARVVDGDTFDAGVQWGPGFGGAATVTPERVRVLGVNTPERGQPGYAEATAFTQQWLGLGAGSTPKLVLLGELTTQVCKRDSFGRVLATVKRVEDGRSLGPDLLAAGLAKPYP